MILLDIGREQRSIWRLFYDIYFRQPIRKIDFTSATSKDISTYLDGFEF